MALRVFSWLAFLAGCLPILENPISDFGPGGTGFFLAEKGEDYRGFAFPEKV